MLAFRRRSISRTCYISAFLFLVAGSGSSEAQAVLSKTVNAAPGQTIRLGFLTTLDRACQSLGEPVVRIDRGPQRGRLRVQKTRGLPDYPAANERNKCNQYSVPGTLVTYTAGKVGGVTDNLALLINFASGSERAWNITVNIR